MLIRWLYIYRRHYIQNWLDKTALDYSKKKKTAPVYRQGRSRIIK